MGIAYLTSLGIAKNLPVFITETGWTHNKNGNFGKVDADYKYAAENIWSDNRIVAVTPFLLSYKDDSIFAIFLVRYKRRAIPIFLRLQRYSKGGRHPMQITSGAILGNLYFPIVQANHGIYGLA